MRRQVNVLLSSAGRRVGLLRAFRSALLDEGLDGRVLAVDASPYSAAFHEADGAWVVPRLDHPDFKAVMLDLCERESVTLLVPTIDTELALYADAREDFARVGTVVSISAPGAVAIAGDKRRTNTFLKELGIHSVRQYPDLGFEQLAEQVEFPAVVKPRGGSAAIGVTKVHDLDELAVALRTTHAPVVEEWMPGDEYTVNAFVNSKGKCLAEVPHRRIEVRAGEVSKGVTTKDNLLMDPVREALEGLEGAFGALCMQCRWDPKEGAPCFFEINARFGGGFPLALEAGAPFPRLLLREVLGQTPLERVENWRDGLVMLRFDEPVFRDARVFEEAARWKT